MEWGRHMVSSFRGISAPDSDSGPPRDEVIVDISDAYDPERVNHEMKLTIRIYSSTKRLTPEEARQFVHRMTDVPHIHNCRLKTENAFKQVWVARYLYSDDVMQGGNVHALTKKLYARMIVGKCALEWVRNAVPGDSERFKWAIGTTEYEHPNKSE
jgi:hypothetical protein